MFESLLVANRGEIAVRVIRTARRLGIRTIAVHSTADADAPHVALADEAVELGPEPPAQSYLDVDAVLVAARRTGAQAVHPGYGFLSENPAFARRVAAAGLVWVGPDPESMERVSDKIDARNLMAAAGVPVAAGTEEPCADLEEAVRAVAEIGYPVMVKPSGGGGGIGMAVVEDETALRAAFDTARTRSSRFFGSDRILLERYIPRARHVEIQVLGLADGRVVALGERDCSVQRRHQKVIEETPSPGVGDELRRRMIDGAVRAAAAVGYRNAGTVECLVDPERQEFVFLEMNTRLQVEHPVTEMTFGVDLVEAQLLIAAGKPVQFEPDDLRPDGHAIEFRVYAEDPVRFLPSPGTLTEWVEPTGEGVRVDAGYRAGNTVSRSYDPLLAKLVVHGADRDEALARSRAAVAAFRISGVRTNLPFLAELLDAPEFVSGRYDTTTVPRLRG
ncbi:acetyl-CoA carboxylase biotin carboxylase subunit [Nakamurella leprariae]|uniref:biotin carboxylase n=1 Tax=Nakamurella leprariae TaxID=2803911 RepID=A0A938YBJ6_9ACTN|nr:biotin carboxylase N-terminal domain-containing protein [Nakamurella leprariae]MBM9467597.1 ATP-grasp domain-containing protein [Nakamurella leprariae]